MRNSRDVQLLHAGADSEEVADGSLEVLPDDLVDVLQRTPSADLQVELLGSVGDVAKVQTLIT